MDFDLTRLGSHEFEHLSQAIAIAVLGTAVTIFGRGPDGGREATFEGNIAYPDPLPDGEQAWSGFGVLQAKFRESLVGTGSDTKWFLGELRKELRTWADPSSARRKRGRIPGYLVVTTNVPLSADPGRGGIDQAHTLLQTMGRRIGIRGYAVWPHDQICRYLDLHDGIRRTYGGFITAGDVLADVQRALAGLRPEEVNEEPLGSLLTKRAARELMAQQWVRLSEAGHRTNDRLRLSEIGVDLPASLGVPGREQEVPGVISHLITCGDNIRKPRPGMVGLPHVVLQGGPGQGKTTVGQLLAQVYRVELLGRRPEHTLGPEVPALLAAYRGHLKAIGLPRPEYLRWPVRVVLTEFADELARKQDLTLLGFIASQTRSDSPINTRMMRAWMQEWPWLLIFDGLDEVSEPEIRGRVLECLSGFLIDAAVAEADIFIVATTRPQGYHNELSENIFAHLNLARMDTGAALRYGEHLARTRFADDPTMFELVIGRLRKAATEEHTRRLMQTPLQVTILTVLLERRAKAPQDRYGLFESYYDTLYEREIGKQTSLSRLLDDHRRDVDALHEQVGRLLQVRSQHAGSAIASLSKEEFMELAVARLKAEGYADSEISRLASELARLATDRLVMLVGYSADTVGFELRSLQELMAARSFFSGTDIELLDQLRRTAHSSHWFNTWIFAVSRLFTEREALRPAVLTLLESLDSENPLAARLVPGARLALEILAETIDVGPQYRRMLLIRALRLLDVSYPGLTMAMLAHVTAYATAIDPTLSQLVLSRADLSRAAPVRDQVAILDFLSSWSNADVASGVAARSRMNRVTTGTPPPHLESALASWREFLKRPDRFDNEWPWEQVLHRLGGFNPPAIIMPVIGALKIYSKPLPQLSEYDIQEAFAQFIEHLESSDWEVAAELSKMIRRRQSLEVVLEFDPGTDAMGKGGGLGLRS